MVLYFKHTSVIPPRFQLAYLVSPSPSLYWNQLRFVHFLKEDVNTRVINNSDDIQGEDFKQVGMLLLVDRALLASRQDAVELQDRVSMCQNLRPNGSFKSNMWVPLETFLKSNLYFCMIWNWLRILSFPSWRDRNPEILSRKNNMGDATKILSRAQAPFLHIVTNKLGFAWFKKMESRSKQERGAAWWQWRWWQE